MKNLPSLFSALLILSQASSSVFAAEVQAPMVRFMQIAQGIYRGAQPGSRGNVDPVMNEAGEHLMSADYAFLKSIGIQTILNLRNPKIEPAIVHKEEELSVRAGLNFENQIISEVTEIEQGQSPIPSDEQLVSALKFISNPMNQPVYIHCFHGKDRTGLVAALYRVYYQNWTPVRAYKEMRMMGFTPLEVGLEAYFWTHATKIDDLTQSLGLSK